MCLILFALQQHSDYPLVVIANRDEFYARPTHNAHWWDDHPEIFAGRDLQAGGTWLGVNRQGRFAAVTNVREPGGMPPGERSRGELPVGFLASDIDAATYLRQLEPIAADYSGYNLLVGDAQQLCFGSNRSAAIAKIEPGIYGVSNGKFDEPWPKLSSGKQALSQALDGDVNESQLFAILHDDDVPADHQLPSTGVNLDIERMLSSRFIQSNEYGTRACTVLLFDRNNRIHLREQNYSGASEPGALVEQIIDTVRKNAEHSD